MNKKYLKILFFLILLLNSYNYNKNNENVSNLYSNSLNKENSKSTGFLPMIKQNNSLETNQNQNRNSTSKLPLLNTSISMEENSFNYKSFTPKYSPSSFIIKSNRKDENIQYLLTCPPSSSIIDYISNPDNKIDRKIIRQYKYVFINNIYNRNVYQVQLNI